MFFKTIQNTKKQSSMPKRKNFKLLSFFTGEPRGKAEPRAESGVGGEWSLHLDTQHHQVLLSFTFKLF